MVEEVDVGLGIGDMVCEEKKEAALVGVDAVDDAAEVIDDPTLSSRKRIGANPRLILISLFA